MARGYVSKTALQRLVKHVGCERVSEEAKSALKEHLEERCMDLAGEGVMFARHAGRKTVRGEDVELVLSRRTS